MPGRRRLSLNYKADSEVIDPVSWKKCSEEKFDKDGSAEPKKSERYPC